MYIYIYMHSFWFERSSPPLKQRPTRQWHGGEGGLRRKPGLSEPRSISEISSRFFEPRPWHIEIRHRVKKDIHN